MLMFECVCIVFYLFDFGGVFDDVVVVFYCI